MFKEILSKDAEKSLASLGNSGMLKEAYLAGGTALALQIGHRYSYDFDFFSDKEFSERIFLQKLKKIDLDFKLEKKEWRTILGYVGETRFSYFYYEYPLLFEPIKFSGINLADPRDIAAMKIAAVSDRGTKRDFIDLYFIFEVDKLTTLSEALNFYDRKFGVFGQNKLHILKSLCYFGDAEGEKTPEMIKKADWVKVKKYFTGEQKKIAVRLLNFERNPKKPKIRN